MDPEPLRATSIESPVGILWLAATSKGLAALEFGGTEERAAARWRARFGRGVQRDPEALKPWAAELEAYFAGRARGFHEPLEILGGTGFQRRAWDAMRRIPYGETRSYKWLAEEAGKPGAARAAGMACNANPLPVVVPCHRVVGSNGSLGGYGAGLGVKRALLRHEGALR